MAGVLDVKCQMSHSKAKVSSLPLDKTRVCRSQCNSVGLNSLPSFVYISPQVITEVTAFAHQSNSHHGNQ